MSDPELILIVDDEPNVRLVFQVALESVGYRCLLASDGEVALAELARTPVSVVLLDLQMPGIGGLETLRRIRDTANEVPVVIVTAYGTVPNAVQAMKLGSIDFLAKPLDPAMLRSVVAEVLRRHAAAPTLPSVPATLHPEYVTIASQFATNLTLAKRALNYRWFAEAEVYLKQAIGLDPAVAEAHNLMGVLHELRNEHDASYKSYKAALKVQPNYGPAQHNIKRYYERITFGTSVVPVDTGEA